MLEHSYSVENIIITKEAYRYTKFYNEVNQGLFI